MQSCSTAVLHGRRLLCAFNASWRVSSMKRLWTNCLSFTILYYVSVLSSYVCDHAASLRISVNADFYFSTSFKCSALGKKSTEQLHPTASLVPRPSVTEGLGTRLPHCMMVNFSTRAVTILLLLHTACISLYTIPTHCNKMFVILTIPIVMWVAQGIHTSMVSHYVIPWDQSG